MINRQTPRPHSLATTGCQIEPVAAEPYIYSCEHPSLLITPDFAMRSCTSEPTSISGTLLVICLSFAVAFVVSACDTTEIDDGPHSLTGTYYLEETYRWRESEEWIQPPFQTGSSSLSEIWFVCAKMIVHPDGQVFAAFKEVGTSWGSDPPATQPPGCDIPPDWSMAIRYYGKFAADDSLAIDSQVGAGGIPFAFRRSEDDDVIEVLDPPHLGSVWRFVKAPVEADSALASVARRNHVISGQYRVQ